MTTTPNPLPPDWRMEIKRSRFGPWWVGCAYYTDTEAGEQLLIRSRWRERETAERDLPEWIWSAEREETGRGLR